MNNSYFKVHFLMKKNFAAGQYKFRVRSASGGSLRICDRSNATGTSVFSTGTGTSYDQTSSYYTLSGDTFLRLIVYKQTANSRISFNYAREPKLAGHLSITAGGGGYGDTVCAGSAITLTADTADGTETQWYIKVAAGSASTSATVSGAILVGTGSSITVTPDSSTTYYVRNRYYSQLSSDTLNVLDVYSANWTTRRLIRVSVPSAPTAPASQTVCSDTAVTFVFDSLVAGAGGDQIEWATNSNFSGSNIVSSGSDVSVTVGVGETDTVWLRSRVSSAGCVSSAITTVLTNNTNPATPFFTWGDTFIFEDSINNICYYAQDEDNVQMKYSIWSGTAVIDSITGCISSHSSNFTVRATATNTLGCKTTADLNVTVTNVAEPEPPSPQVFKTDTPYTFVFSSIAAGNNANQIEWSFNRNFSGSTILSSPATINITLEPGSDTLIWLRSRNSSNQRVSRALATVAKTLYGPISAGLLDKTNWSKDWFDEFTYGTQSHINNTTNQPPQNFEEHWLFMATDKADCDRLIGCSD